LTIEQLQSRALYSIWLTGSKGSMGKGARADRFPPLWMCKVTPLTVDGATVITYARSRQEV
jgi:hypothetical protein